ncbi:aminotransferase class IV [Motiliproteus sp. MSK22-1]|uniref:aminotransferase class IV n=1 Tax=Motiliproteus sp. MSK22-1 TaxID=1897630 RepID=UPI0009765ABC|nr:aminotransferase class IV [Motiliproteus sp. MSK22-1]OMH37964.1 branched-chain amino acid transferase [Motiliproteus sp. MSK22-1]
MNDKYKNGVAYIDDAYIALAEAKIPILDRGFVRSDATYDVAHVWNGSFFRLDDHIERFYWSMDQLRMSLPYSKAEIKNILTKCVALSGLKNAYVQMTCTRGVPTLGNRDPRLCKNRFYAFAQPFVWIATPDQQDSHFSMVISNVERISSNSIDTRIKNFHWLDLTMGILDAYDQGALVSALLDGQGNITEGAGFNIFSVKNNTLITPDKNIFEGMTRRTIIEIAEKISLPCETRSLSPEELRNSDEIFITSTAGGVMPITELDHQPINNGETGGITKKLRTLYWERLESDPKCIPVDYEKESV